MGLVAAEHVQRGRLALVEGDVPVLDPHPPAAVDDALVLGDVAGGVDARDRRSRSRESTSTPPRLAERRARPPRASITSGTAPAPITTASASSSSPPFVTTVVTWPSAPSNRSSSSSPWTAIPCSSSRLWKNRPACSPKPRLSGDRLEHHHRARAAELGQRRRDLAARCTSRRSARRACRRRPRGSCRCCRACAGSGCRRARSRGRSGGGRSRRSRAAPCRTDLLACWTA